MCIRTSLQRGSEKLSRRSVLSPGWSIRQLPSTSRNWIFIASERTRCAPVTMADTSNARLALRFMKKNDVKRQVAEAISACQEKKAEEISILELEKGSGAFTDYFVVCSGTNPRQIQAISDEVEERLKKSGMAPTHVEGYKQAEWVLLDYVDFVVHIFSEKSRRFYDLERLWKSAKHVNPSELTRTRTRRAASRSSLQKRA